MTKVGCYQKKKKKKDYEKWCLWSLKSDMRDSAESQMKASQVEGIFGFLVMHDWCFPFITPVHVS